ncbi:Ger(x)C family spore germination C-terminal domain-containing protein [Paenibacillus silvisoli]|uniref:Ger(x)C family spore germination C-terminal domain-containing protein n=1 Tax=Paenibacillus silvisoli TaxID=3110539 RepID=UPI002803C4D8|nr:Ger(x)C family spore germination C-terminal domain-containing protein [Paenibacillus silvisoli]
MQAASVTTELGGTLYTTELDISRGKFAIHADANPPVIEYKVNARGVLQEVNTNATIGSEELLQIEQAQEAMLRGWILDLLGCVQRNNIDPFGFGLWYTATRLDNKTKWQAWQRLYPNVRFKASVNIALYSTGEIR